MYKIYLMGKINKKYALIFYKKLYSLLRIRKNEAYQYQKKNFIFIRQFQSVHNSIYLYCSLTVLHTFVNKKPIFCGIVQLLFVSGTESERGDRRPSVLFRISLLRVEIPFA